MTKTFKMTKAKRKKFLRNLLRFSAPGLAAFFGQLALGATPQVALITASLVFWGLLADYFSKIK